MNEINPIFDDLNIESTNAGELASFEYRDQTFRITRAAGLSNLYLIHCDDVGTDWAWSIGLAVWTAPRNEFAISTDGFTHIPYDVLLPNLRAANTRYLELIRNAK